MNVCTCVFARGEGLVMHTRTETSEARYLTSPIRNLTLTQTHTTSDVIPAMLNVVPQVCTEDSTPPTYNTDSGSWSVLVHSLVFGCVF